MFYQGTGKSRCWLNGKGEFYCLGALNVLSSGFGKWEEGAWQGGERNLETSLTLWLPWKLRGTLPVAVMGQSAAPHKSNSLQGDENPFVSDLSDLERRRSTSSAGKWSLKVLWCLKRQLQTFLKWFSWVTTRNWKLVLGQSHQTFVSNKVCTLKT